MNSENIKLIEPVVDLKLEFLAMAEEFKAEGRDAIDGIGCIEADDFENSVRCAKDHVKGIRLPQGWVPASTYWLVRDGVLIGTCHLRHELNDFLKNYGGHIGYYIRPSQRRKGYGNVILELTIEKAGCLGLKKVLVTCDDDNFASARIIEKRGGVFEDKITNKGHEVPTRRYWIKIQ